MARTPHRTLTKAPNEYLQEDVGAISAKQMDRAGIAFHPGKQIGYVILNTKAKVKEERARATIFLTGDESYDKEKYIELLLRAAETLLAPLGYPVERIQSWLETS